MANTLDRSLIAGLEIFSQMPADELDAMLASARVRQLPAGEAAFEQGDEARDFFILLHGRLKVVQTTEDGQQIIIRHINPGEPFGIARAIRRPDYPASAVAAVDSLALAWPSSQWDAFAARSPVLSSNALKAVGQRLQDSHDRVREMATQQVERRIAHAVLRLINQAGRKTPDGIEIDFPLTRQDIAEMTGTTLHTVSRTLSAWEEKGIVESGRKRITVRDAHRLFLLSEGKTD